MSKHDELRIPSEAEIAELPRWAQVAFAARCARRVQPLFSFAWPTAPPPHSRGVELAIATSENSYFSAIAARAIGQSVDAAGEAGVSVAREVAYIAYLSTRASHSSVMVTSDEERMKEDINKTANFTSAACNNTIVVAGHVGASSDVERIVSRDFEAIQYAAKHDAGIVEQHGRMIYPSYIFGQMWPEGTPEGWPILKDEGDPLRLKCEIVTPAGLTDQESVEFNTRVAQFFSKLSAAHVAMGGNGLRLIENASTEEEPAFEEEPVNAGGGMNWGCA